MDANWHHAFNPQEFLRRVDVEHLLERNDAYAENRTDKLGKPCILCGGMIVPGLLLNEGSYICRHCFNWISAIRYPEKYENLRRQHLIASEAHHQARKSMIDNSRPLKIKQIADWAFWLSFLLYFIHIGFIALTVVIFLVDRYSNKLHVGRLKRWDAYYPEPQEPLLRHFHDPVVELTTRDKTTLYVFNHWPGYPPFWGYLREVVLAKDHWRCQVSGCPSRLELHIHHIKPISEGGEHSPANLVTLCDFHHALEPDKGHERIWGNIKTRYFTLVRSHERSNRVNTATHTVRAHLRRLQLVSADELRELTQIYGFACLHCGNTRIEFTLHSRTNTIEVNCPACSKLVAGPQGLTEETGPRLAELLRVTRNPGRWKARWNMLAGRKDAAWGTWNNNRATRRRKDYKKRIKQDLLKPMCPRCGATMRLIRPKPRDSWKPFWGCSKFKITDCRGSVKYVEIEYRNN